MKNKEIAPNPLEQLKRFSLILDHLNDIVFIINLNLEFEYMNSEVSKKLLGCTEIDTIGKNLLDFIHPDDKKDALKAIKNGFKYGEGRVELRIKDITNNYHFYDLKGKIFKDYDDRQKGLIICSDITEKKFIEQKLIDSEEKYRLISENANDIIGVLNKDYNIEYVNEQALRNIGGYSVEEIIGKSGLNFVHPEDITKTIESLNKGVKEGKDTVEIRFMHKNGFYLWFEVTGKTFIDKKGDLKGTVILRDISERKHTELKLLESEENFRLISEHSNDLICVLNNKFKMEYINEKTHLNLLGYTKVDLIRRYAGFLRHPDENREMNDLIRMVLKYGEASQEGRLKHKNGTWLWFDIRAKLFQDQYGNWKGLLVSRDIHDKKETEMRLKESERKYREAYERANFYKDLFAHDINNFLQFINSSAELISLNHEKSHLVLDTVNLIKNQVLKSKVIIRNANILTLLEDTQLTVKKIEVNELLGNAINYIKNAYSDRVIDLHTEFYGKKKCVVLANELLQDVFENILINAVKYNENPIVRILIRTSQKVIQATKYIQLDFIDNGIGISDHRKKFIFTQQNIKVGGGKGMGIGLSLVKRILEQFNGRIWMEDNVNGDHSKGSKFIVLLPEN